MVNSVPVSATTQHIEASIYANNNHAEVAASCEVTPQAQNTGISPGLIVTGSPKSGRSRLLMPISCGSPRSTGAPWVR